MKALWKGSITFGLVTIDIDLFSAIKQHVVSFKLLHSTCEKPLRNLRWCPHCEVAVTWDQVVKGLPAGKNKFIVMTKEAVQKLKPLRTDIIVIETFIDQEELEPLWFDQHYYALSHKEKDRAYGLFVQALLDSGKVGIGRTNNEN